MQRENRCHFGFVNFESSKLSFEFFARLFPCVQGCANKPMKLLSFEVNIEPLLKIAFVLFRPLVFHFDVLYVLFCLHVIIKNIEKLTQRKKKIEKQQNENRPREEKK